MRELIKFLMSVVLLIVVVAIALPMVIDPNDYRDDIQAAVKEQTGRDLLIKGDLSLSVFPWVGLGISNVSLSNSEGFSAEFFAEIEEANIKIKLLPLLSQQVEVSTVVLKGMRINLAKDKTGRSNWDDMVQPSDKEAKPAASDANNEASGAAAAIAIGGLQIVDANIIWDDASKGEKYSLIDFDLTTDALSLGKPMGINLAFTVDSSKPKATVRLKLNGDLLINTELNKFDLQGLTMAIDAAGEPVPGGAMRIDIASHLIADLSGDGSLTLNPLSIKFDDSMLSGSAAVNHFSKPAIRFDLAVDTINVDRYLPTPAPEAEQGKATKVAVPVPAAAALIPVQTIRDLNIDGEFKVASLVINGLKAQGASISILAKNGVLTSKQGIEAFYNGSYSGTTIIDARQNTPKITVKENASGVDIEPLLIDLLGESPIAGTANITADITTRGQTVPAFKKALNGTASFSFNDGAVTGIDVGALMKQAQAVLNGDLSAAFIKGAGKTPFSEMSGTAQITNGLVSNQDLLVETPLVNVKGSGTANLVSEGIDYQLTLQRTKASSAEEIASDDVKNLLIPVNVTGSFSEPKVALDVKGMVMETQKAKIDEKKEELKEKLREKINDKLKGRAGDLLKGLF